MEKVLACKFQRCPLSVLGVFQVFQVFQDVGVERTRY